MVAHLCAARANADLSAEELDNTGQINPDELMVLGAANMQFDGQPEGLDEAVSGVEFDDVIWGEQTELSTGATLEGSVAGAVRTANTGGSIDGDGADVLAEIANSINFYNVNTDGTLIFGKLPVNHAVIVQLITSDAASSFDNWAGHFTITTVDSGTDQVTEIGDFEAGTEPDNLDAQIATFDATTDSNGGLQIGIDQTEGGQHAGIGGVIVYSAISEILGIDLNPTDFVTSLGANGAVGTLRAIDQKEGATHSYSFAEGDGSADNDKFTIAGDQLSLGDGHDFSASADGEVFMVRVRSTDNGDAARQLEVAITLTIHSDADADLLWDSWEVRHTEPDNLETLSGNGVADADGDTLSDLREFELSLGEFPNISPTSADSDDDGLGDAEELAGAGARPPTDPTLADSDGDGLGDSAETATGVFAGEGDTGSNPRTADSDGDGIDDGAEVNGMNPRGFDSDPNRTDTDGDGVGDTAELDAGTDPSNSGDFPKFNAVPLTDTSQINPAVHPVLAAVNFIFANQPEGLGGTVNGVEFEDVIWDEETDLSTGVSVLGSTAGDVRTANTESTISGEDEEILENIANSINFYNVDTDGTLTFSELTPGLPVIVQLITGDAASRVNNWAGIFEISIVDTVSETTTPLGEFQAGTEPNNADAQLATFGAIVDGDGVLEILIDQTEGGQHAGIGGVVVLEDGAALPFAIIDVQFDSAAKTSTVRWNSSAGKTYAIEASDDLATWIELDDGIPSGGEVTIFTESDIPEGSDQRYYRVR